jgi:hypothetical protein
MLIPGYLSRMNMQYVEQCMLGEAGDIRPPAVCHISDTDSPQWKLDAGGYDKSFSTQMAVMHSDSESVDPTLSTKPNAYLVTAYSGVPVADSIRGFYDELGEEAPFISHIHARRKLKRDFENGVLSETFFDEASRLESLLDGAEHVCVVDQFVQTGQTLRYAEEVLKYAGITNVSAIRGRWYDDASRRWGKIDLDKTTSKHAGRMHEIGIKSCQKAFGE